VTATAWAKAPIAFFPTYSFSVRRGSGARIAIPASSLPVGLGLLRADEVTGTVVLADSRVYGVPLESLWQQVQDWAGAAHVRDMLKALAVESDGDPVYVRVVSRVYLVGRIDVSLINSSTAVAQAEVGLPPEIKLLEQPSEDATKRFKEANAALNSILASATEAGGAVKFTHVSRRAVTAKETFSRPLVIGYLGFDFPVLGTGELGIPVATTRTLAGEPPEGGGHALGRFTSDQWVIGNLRAAIRSFDAGQQDEIYAAAARDLGAEFEIAYLAARRINATLPARDAFTATLVALDASPEWSRHRVRESLAKALSQFTQENSR